MMAELTDSTNRAQVSVLTPLAWAVGITIGCVIPSKTLTRVCTHLQVPNSPVAGGLLSRPHERFPTLFGNWFWKEYPYLLPCLFSAVFCASCFIIIWLFLEEVRALERNLAASSDFPPFRLYQDIARSKMAKKLVRNTHTNPSRLSEPS